MVQTESVEILLVEDNPHDADLTIRSLKKHNLGNRLVHVEDGVAALDFVFGRGKYATETAVQRPKVILLDIKLPKLDGLDVLKEIKSHPETQAIPVVMLTSSREDPDIQRAYHHGANSYVVKPVDFESFREAVSTLGMYWLLVNQTSNP
jgi:two-component system, response regulator